MNHTGRLPEGIKILRRFEVDNGATISRRSFERLVNSLDQCAVNNEPKAINCHSCHYLNECLERFDAICGRVVMYRRRNKAETMS
jgi:hypothetical protein